MIRGSGGKTYDLSMPPPANAYTRMNNSNNGTPNMISDAANGIKASMILGTVGGMASGMIKGAAGGLPGMVAGAAIGTLKGAGTAIANPRTYMGGAVGGAVVGQVQRRVLPHTPGIVQATAPIALGLAAPSIGMKTATMAGRMMGGSA